MIETHISTLLFVRDRVHKLLKPVRAGFIDHSTAARRIAAVTAEYELNRRLAPDVYLGVSDLFESGECVDRLLTMRRLPDERSLSKLVIGPDGDDHLRRVAHTIAAFHAGLPPVYEPVPLATAAGLQRFWESSLVDLAPAIGDLIEPEEFAEVERLAVDYLGHHEELFERRRAAGFVRDGHGDLIADDIFMLDDGPRILDCLAFDADYRTSDVLADIAFLVMDVEQLAGRGPSGRLMRWYCELTNEHHPSSLAHHYVAYRAHVRAKVNVLRHRQGEAAAAPLARRYHRQAVEHLRRAEPTLVMLGGGPGTGKTTIAGRLADALNWSVLDSDTLRKDLAGIDHQDHDVAAHPNLYSDGMTLMTYQRLVAHASRLLSDGESVILDATWSKAVLRELARAAAKRHGARVVEVECVLDPRLARTRLVARQRRGLDPSDAGPELVERMANARESWPTARQLDTSDEADAVVERLVTLLFE